MATTPSDSGSWEAAFVAMAALLGEPRDTILAALGPSSERARGLLDALALPSRELRARAIARGLSDAIVALESSELT